MSTTSPQTDIWLAAGVRTPFAKLDGGLSSHTAISMSVPVAQAMVRQLNSSQPDMVIWGTVAQHLAFSNLARDVCLDAGLDPNIPAMSTIMACSTSMAAVFQAAGQLGRGDRELAICGGSETMSRIQIGLTQGLSDWIRRVVQARRFEDRLKRIAELSLKDIGLFIPSIKNRVTGKSMGEHCEDMAKAWHISREAQDTWTLASHQRAVEGQRQGFFDDLLIEVDGIKRDAFPRASTSLEKLARLKPVFDRTSGQGTLTAGNASPLTDGAAAIWVATTQGLARLPSAIPRVRLVDWELAGVDIHTEGLLMAPAYAIPRLLARHDLRYDDIDVWEIHEAFAAQVLCNIAALEDAAFRRDKVGVDRDFGTFPVDRVNPNGGSIALGHPFGATGARILSQAVKELAVLKPGQRAIVSICADGGVGTVALLERA